MADDKTLRLWLTRSMHNIETGISSLMLAHDRGMTEEKRLHSIALRQTANFSNPIKLMLPVQSLVQK